MLISEAIHKLTSISRQVDDITIYIESNNEFTEVINIAVVKIENKHYAVIQTVNDIKDQVA